MIPMSQRKEMKELLNIQQRDGIGGTFFFFVLYFGGVVSKRYTVELQVSVWHKVRCKNGEWPSLNFQLSIFNYSNSNIGRCRCNVGIGPAQSEGINLWFFCFVLCFSFQFFLREDQPYMHSSKLMDMYRKPDYSREWWRCG